MRNLVVGVWNWNGMVILSIIVFGKTKEAFLPSGPIVENVSIFFWVAAISPNVLNFELEHP